MKYFDANDLYASLKLIGNNETAQFEKEFAHYIGAKHAIATSFGRTSLYLGLRAVDVVKKEVIIPAFICTVVRHAVVAAGGIPRFVDVDLDDLTINLDDLKGNISEQTKAIILVHYFGRVARNINDVIQIARRNNLILIEDCAHSLGAEYNGRKVGTFGDFSIFSLTKSMINFGGGMLVTNDHNIYRNAKNILDQQKTHLRKRIVECPLIVAYGFEQAIDKLIFDRFRKSIFKWWLIALPRILLISRQYIIKLVKLALATINFKRRKRNYPVYDDKGSSSNGYVQSIHMEPIIASLARTQLRKVDYLNQRRKEVASNLSKLSNYHLRDLDGFVGKDVYTHVVLTFPNSDIFDIIEKCKNRGLLLRPTWPTHQKLWKNQDTTNVKKIEKEFLTWNVNPMVTDREIQRFHQIITEISKSTGSS